MAYLLERGIVRWRIGRLQSLFFSPVIARQSRNKGLVAQETRYSMLRNCYILSQVIIIRLLWDNYRMIL